MFDENFVHILEMMREMQCIEMKGKDGEIESPRSPPIASVPPNQPAADVEAIYRYEIITTLYMWYLNHCLRPAMVERDGISITALDGNCPQWEKVIKNLLTRQLPKDPFHSWRVLINNAMGVPKRVIEISLYISTLRGHFRQN